MRLTNGVTVTGICEPTTVALTIRGITSLFMSGTLAQGSSLASADQSGPGTNEAIDASSVDYDVIAYGNGGVTPPPPPLPAGWSGNARIDVHGERNGTTCSFRGMTIPSG